VPVGYSHTPVPITPTPCISFKYLLDCTDYGTVQEVYWFQEEQRGAGTMQTVEITRVKGHVEVYDQNGRFLFSADTEQEARDDLRAWGVV